MEFRVLISVRRLDIVTGVCHGWPQFLLVIDGYVMTASIHIMFNLFLIIDSPITWRYTGWDVTAWLNKKINNWIIWNFSWKRRFFYMSKNYNMPLLSSIKNAFLRIHQQNFILDIISYRRLVCILAAFVSGVGCTIF